MLNHSPEIHTLNKMAADGKRRFKPHEDKIYEHLGLARCVEAGGGDDWDSMTMEEYTTDDHSGRCKFHFIIEHKGYISCPCGTPYKLGELCGWTDYYKGRLATYIPVEWDEVEILLDKITLAIQLNFTKI